MHAKKEKVKKRRKEAKKKEGRRMRREKKSGQDCQEDPGNDPFPRRSSPTSNWSSDPLPPRLPPRQEVVAKITLQARTIPQLQHFP